METLSNLFGTTTGLPRLIADLVCRFLQFLPNPYASVLQTCKFLRRGRISTDVLLISAFALFVLSLGIPNTGDLIALTFKGGLADSLRKLPAIETKSLLYVYLSLFVFGAAVFSIVVGYAVRWCLRLRRRPARLFPDIFNVYVSFTIGWFILFAIVSAKIPSFQYWTSLRASIGEVLRGWGLSDVSEVIVSPAFAIIIVMSVYFAWSFLKHWGLRRDFVDLLRKDARGAFSQTQMITFPIVVAAVMIVGPTIFLAALCDVLYAKSENEAHFMYEASCVKNAQDLHANFSVKNNLARNAMMGPLFLGLWQSVPDGDRRPDQVVKIDLRDIMWASRKGLFLEPSEVKYLRLVSTLPLSMKDVAHCKLMNNARGGAPCKAEAKPGSCREVYQYITLKTDGDAVSSLQAAVAAR